MAPISSGLGIHNRQNAWVLVDAAVAMEWDSDGGLVNTAIAA